MISITKTLIKLSEHCQDCESVYFGCKKCKWHIRAHIEILEEQKRVVFQALDRLGKEIGKEFKK